MYKSYSLVKYEPSSLCPYTLMSVNSPSRIYYTRIQSRVTLANGMESKPSAENTDRFSISKVK